MKSRPNNQHQHTSPSKLEGAGGRVSNRIEAHTPQSLRYSSPNLGEQGLPLSSPSKIEGEDRRSGGVCHNYNKAHTPHPNLGEQVLRTKNTANMKLFRRELRNNSTKAEKTLWNLLRGKSINGLQFRRQYSVDDKILDFYCPKIKLAIELDGDYHYHGGMIASDADRDQSLLKSYGITTLRFENSIVIEKPWIVANSIRNYVDSTTSPSNVRGGRPKVRGRVS